MPRGSLHRKWTRRLLGDSHAEVHRWLDAPHRLLGRKHRVLFHDPISAPILGSLAALRKGKNPVTGALAGLLHAGQDRIDTALGGSRRRRKKRKGGAGRAARAAGAIGAQFVALVEDEGGEQSVAEDSSRVSEPPPPPPPSELETFVLAKRREGMSRRDIAMQLIKRGYTCEDAQELLSVLPREQTERNASPPEGVLGNEVPPPAPTQTGARMKLHEAARGGDVEAVKSALRAGADANAPGDAEDGDRPLFSWSDFLDL